MLKKLREMNRGPSPQRKKSKKLKDLTISYKYVVVGGGVAAGYACKQFVEEKVAPRSVAVISKEAVAPYERPALTKSYLHPPQSSSRVRLPDFYTCAGTGGELQTEKWYLDNGIELYLAHEAVSLDAKSNTLVCQSIVDDCKVIITYEKLIMATGSRPLFTDVFPPEAILKNIFVLRNEKDGSMLVRALEKKKRGHVLLVGGGYLGMECAAALSGWEFAVTIVLPEDRVLKRLFTPEMSKWYEGYFKKVKNIKIIKNKEVQSFTGTNRSPTTLKYAILEDGTRFEVDFVVIGIGAVLNTELADGQVKLARKPVKGIYVDQFLQSSDPNIYAIGDIAAFPLSEGGHGRFEHVDNARLTAKVAVKNIVHGNSEVHDYFPFVYSRLFEYTKHPVICHFYGNRGNDNASVVHFGDYTTIQEVPQAFGAFYVGEGNKVVGGILVNGNKQSFAELREIIMKKTVLSELTAVAAQALFKTMIMPTPMSKPKAVAQEEARIEKQRKEEEEKIKSLPPETSFFLAAAQAYQNLKPVPKKEEEKKAEAVETGEEETEEKREPEPEGKTEKKFEVYDVGPASYAVVKPGRCVLDEEWTPYPLIKKMQISDNSYIFTFGIPQNRFLEDQRLNLSTAACILALPSGGKTITDEFYNYLDYKPPICPLDDKPYPPRPYTPVSTNAMVSQFELLVKIYPDGKFTQHLNSLVPGESTVMFKHVEGNVKIQYPFGSKPRIGFIVGGTGVNPIIQMLHAILGNPADNTRVSMIYGNRTQLDILGRQILDAWEKDYSQLSVQHTLSQEPEGSNWSGVRGRITADLVKDNTSFPIPQEDCTIFVCGPPGMYESVCGPRGKGGFCTAGDFTGFLKDLGYKPGQVYKF